MNAPLKPSLISISSVTHVGTLNPQDKGVRGPSYEGMGLSFSKHPEAWIRIAKLGAGSWWSVDISGCKILDAHSFIDANEDALVQWGVDNGWIHQTQAYRVQWFDEEMNSDMEMLCGSQAEAENEAEFYEDVIIEPVHAFTPTPKLVQFMGSDPSNVGKPSLTALSDIAVAWAQDNGLHGVWWEETLDVEGYSAPRGVIFAQYVPDLTFIPVDPEVSANRRRMRL